MTGTTGQRAMRGLRQGRSACTTLTRSLSIPGTVPVDPSFLDPMSTRGDGPRRPPCNPDAAGADCGYDVSGPFRDCLAERGLQYVVDVTNEMVVFPEQTRLTASKVSTVGRSPKRSRLTDDQTRPVSSKELAGRSPRPKVTWREGTKVPISGRFVWLRIWPAGVWATGDCVGAGDPPGDAATAGPGQSARLCVLPAMARSRQAEANG